jgi:tRNA (guanine-N7-)-methyltransferase
MSKNSLYITQKRKKWKYWHFDNFKNCLHLDSASHKDLGLFLAGAKEVILEIGAGTANLSLELARRKPEAKIIAVDVKSDRLYTGAKQALAEGLDNVFFLRGHVQQLREVLKESSIDLIWVTFPDPFSKDRQAKHRLSGAKFLALYKFLLKDGGRLKFKTDDADLFKWSVLEIEEEGWELLVVEEDLHGPESSQPEDRIERVMTTYELKFVKLGKKIGYLEAKLKG